MLAADAEKRVRRAVEMARACVEKPELESMYLRRFHRAMDDLQSVEEGEAVYDRCRSHGWYQLAAAALSTPRPTTSSSTKAPETSKEGARGGTIGSPTRFSRSFRATRPTAFDSADPRARKGASVADWKQTHADASEKALGHALVKGVIEEQMGNIGSDSALVRYGLVKIATYAAQVARAQALGFDPDLLRLSSEEANVEQLRLARAAVAAGKPVWLLDDEGATRLD